MSTTPKGGVANPIAQKKSRSEKIRALNDAFRQTPKAPYVFLSLEVAQIGETMLKELFTKLQSYSSFTPTSDPDGDRSSGAMDVGRYKIEWSIDYWDLDEEDDSPDPSNASVTIRMMNIIMA